MLKNKVKKKKENDTNRYIIKYNTAKKELNILFILFH